MLRLPSALRLRGPGAVSAAGVAVQRWLARGDGGAGSSPGPIPSKAGGRTDSAARCSPPGSSGSLRPRPSAPAAVKHRHRARVNPDASLLAGAGDSGAGVQHGRSAHGGSTGSVARQRAARPGEPGGRTRVHSSGGRGHSGYRSSPGADNRRRGTDGHCPASATPADENWKESPEARILRLGPCHARAGGAVPGRLAGQGRYRTFLNGPDRLPDHPRLVIWRRLLPPAGAFPTVPLPKAGAHHPRWRSPAQFTNHARVSRAIHRPRDATGTRP